MTEFNLDKPLIPVTQFITSGLATEISAPITPLGGIIYADNNKALLLGESDGGKLIGRYSQVPEDFSLDQLIGGKGRFVLLNHLEEVIVGQIGLGDEGIVETFQSLEDMSSVAVRFCYEDVVAREKNVLTLDEEEIMRFLVGETGGIARFKGAGLTEENALIFEPASSMRYGLAFFLHPQESRWGINSVMGAQLFFKSLNSQFEERAQCPRQNEVTRALDRNLDQGIIKFRSEARAAIFRAQVIANARMWERTGDTKYQDFLRSCLEMSPFKLVLNRALMGLGIRGCPEKTKLVNDVVNGLILNNQGQQLGTSKAEERVEGLEREYGIYSSLLTKKAKRIRSAVDTCFGDENDEMYGYFRNLIDMIQKSRSPEEIHDIGVLVYELGAWKFEKSGWHWCLNPSDSVDKVSFNTGGTYNIIFLVKRLEQEVEKQKARHYII